MKDSSTLAWIVSIVDAIISGGLVVAYACYVLTSTNSAVKYFIKCAPVVILSIPFKLWACYQLHQAAKQENIEADTRRSLQKVKCWIIISSLFCVVEITVGLAMKDIQFWMPMSGFIATNMISIVIVMPFRNALRNKIYTDLLRLKSRHQEQQSIIALEALNYKQLGEDGGEKVKEVTSDYDFI